MNDEEGQAAGSGSAPAADGNSPAASPSEPPRADAGGFSAPSAATHSTLSDLGESKVPDVAHETLPTTAIPTAVIAPGADAPDAAKRQKQESRRWLKLVSYRQVKAGANRKKRYIPVERTVRVSRARMTSAILKFSKLYGPQKMSYRVMITLALALVSGFLSMLLVQNTGLYSFGVSAFVQGFARLAYVDLALNGGVAPDVPNLVYQLIFWVLYVIVNIPLMVFSWYKISHRFTILSIIYVVSSNAFGFILGVIPGINSISLFTSANDSILSNWLNNPGGGFALSGGTRSFLDGVENTYGGVLRFVPTLWQVPNEAGKAVALLCYGVVYAFESAVIYTIVYLTGGSTGGTDFFTEWYARRKFRSMGSVLLYVSTTLLILGVLIGSYVPGSMVMQKLQDAQAVNAAGAVQYLSVDGWTLNPRAHMLGELAWQPSLYFSPNIVGTLIGAVLFSLLMNQMYPRFNLAQLQIYSGKTMEIREKLLSDNHPHTMSIQELIGGFSLDRRQAILTISMYKDLPRLIAQIKEIDGDCLVAITRLRGIDGYMYVYQDE